MIDFHDFFRLIAPNCVNAPVPIIEQSLLLTAIKFCERTRMWRNFDVITTDGVEPEPISVPNDSVLFEVSACSQNRRRLDPISIDELVHRHPRWRVDPICGWGSSRWFICPEFGTILAVPKCPGVLHVETVLKPSATARTLPDFLLDQYGTDIANGASALVLMKPDETYGNPQLGAQLGAMFQQRLGALSNMGSAGQQKAKARSRARFF